MFAFVFGKLISRLKDDLHSIGIWDPTDWTLDFPREDLLKCPDSPRSTPCNLDVIWADDLALAFRRPLASDTTQAIKTAAEFLFEWCTKYGMRPNTDRGKTEILFQFRGPGSRAERMRLFEAEQPCLQIEPSSMPPVCLHLVAVYKHLGAQLTFWGQTAQGDQGERWHDAISVQQGRQEGVQKPQPVPSTTWTAAGIHGLQHSTVEFGSLV